jgi:hypothetical protein
MGTLGFKPTLVRWRYDQPATCSNVVLMDEPFANIMEELAQQGKYPTPETFDAWAKKEMDAGRFGCFCV